VTLGCAVKGIQRCQSEWERLEEGLLRDRTSPGQMHKDVEGSARQVCTTAEESQAPCLR
jgi:hypothetical protein